MNPLYSRLAVGFLIWFLGVPAVNAGCNVGVSLLDPNASFAGSIYDDGSTRRCTALEPVQWYPGDPREVVVFADADFRRSSPQPEVLASLMIHADIYLLRPEVPEADFEGPRASHIAAQLAGLAPEMHVACEWSRTLQVVDRVGSAGSVATLLLGLREPSALPDGRYWLMVRLPLDDAGTLGCPHERPRGIFTPLIALIVGPPTSLRERAFREYREIVRNFRLMSADRVSPNPAPEQHAAASDNALEAATRLVAVDANSSFGWEMLGRVHDARHEATPAITAYRKAAELLVAGAPDLVTIPEEAGWGEQPRPARLQQRIDALSLPQPRFEGAP